MYRIIHYLSKVIEIYFYFYFIYSENLAYMTLGTCLFTIISGGYVRDTYSLWPFLWCMLFLEADYTWREWGQSLQLKVAGRWFPLIMTHYYCLLLCKIPTTWTWLMFQLCWWSSSFARVAHWGYLSFGLYFSLTLKSKQFLGWLLW